MGSIIQRQPFKTLYLILSASLLLFVKLPVWIIRYSSSSRRPRPAWTLKRALIIRSFKEVFRIAGKVGRRTSVKTPTPKEVPDSSLTDAKFVWLEPIPDDLFRGEIRRVAEITGVEPARIPGYWLLKKKSTWAGGKAKPGEKTVLHLHGGAFYLGSAHPSDTTALFTRGLLEHSQTVERTFAVDYRLTASDPDPPAHPFPTAVLDSLAGYRYLVLHAGFAPENITVAGDSAGGNLAVALVRHLVENPDPALPPPGRLLVVSPWLDLAASRDGPDSSAVKNAPSDIFDETRKGLFGKYGIMGLLGPMELEVAQTNRYLSPVSLRCMPTSEEAGLFKGFPETYVVAGGAERLLDDSKALAERMRKDGVTVTEDISPDGVHDFVIFRWHEPERTDTLKRVAQWLDTV
ncbi:alpha/beta-hydrolase [Fomes fomentarius]|nr:alpha/beta-hydrolase [Fomes fomentarius]